MSAASPDFKGFADPTAIDKNIEFLEKQEANLLERIQGEIKKLIETKYPQYKYDDIKDNFVTFERERYQLYKSKIEKKIRQLRLLRSDVL